VGSNPFRIDVGLFDYVYFAWVDENLLDGEVRTLFEVLLEEYMV
jgi:hypothetical protein